MFYPYGENWVDPGFSADDDKDGNLTNSVSINGEINPWVLGSQSISYSVEDEAGNQSSKTRTVCVIPNSEDLLGVWDVTDNCGGADFHYVSEIVPLDSFSFKLKNLSAFSPDFRVEMNLTDELRDKITFEDEAGHLDFIGTGQLFNIDSFAISYTVTDTLSSSQNCSATFKRR